MAYTLDFSTTDTIDLSDYLEYMSQIDLSDTDQVLASGAMLKALANNRRFVVDKLNDELLSWRNFQPGNNATAQTLVLGSGDGFYVRANMWSPPSRASGVQDWERSLYSYQRPHDHNFSFMTVGYFGSGYATSIYEYDPDQTIGVPGELVGLRFLERTTLPTGKIMFYRAGRDVHSQEHPEEFSISVNLMLHSQESTNRNQYYFNLDNHTIEDYIPTSGTGRVALCSLARHIGNGETASALEEIASRHSMPRVRAAAFESLAVLSGAEHATWERAMQDKHPLVREVARRSLEEQNALARSKEPHRNTAG